MREKTAYKNATVKSSDFWRLLFRKPRKSHEFILDVEDTTGDGTRLYIAPDGSLTDEPPGFKVILK